MEPTAALRELVEPVTRADEQVLPVLPELSALLPGGALRRGSTVVVLGGASLGGTSLGGTSLVMALAAGPSASGSWCAAVGLPSLGLVATAEMGVALERLALVREPGRSWAAVVAALVDAIDVVVIRPPGPVRPADVRRLSARARERGAVLVPLCSGWEGADVRLSVTGCEWEGLGAGHGHLRARRLEVLAQGRGAAARPRRACLWLPAS